MDESVNEKQQEGEQAQPSVPTLLKKVKQLQEIIIVKDEQIDGLQKALGAVSEFQKADKVSPPLMDELKMLRQAYISFSKKFQGVDARWGMAWEFEVACDPMVKGAWLIYFKMWNNCK